MNYSLAAAFLTLPLTGPSPQGMPHRSQLDGIRPAASTLDVLTFRGRPAGSIVSEFFGRFGAGPILINGNNPDLGGQNAAVIFSSANPTGGDPDLGTPNEDFGGPGVGDGGSAGAAYPNRRRLGNVLIVAENLTDADGDGLVDDPADSADSGTSLTFDFSAIGGATMERMTILDVESVSMPAVVEMIGPAGELLASQILPIVGDNGVAQIDLGQVPNVMLLHIALGGSAAIDNIVFEPFQGSTLTGRVWDDEDEDGLQGPDEPGLPSVDVFLTSTGLGPVAFATTDGFGNYTFSSIAAGSYQLSVSEETLPVGAYQTPCDVGDDDTIDNDCSPASVEVEFTSNIITTDFGFAAPVECAGTIGDLVFLDVNGNNIQDVGDFGILGATVLLHDELTGNLLDIQITDENGNYEFGGLCEGTYAVSIDITTYVDPAGDRPPLGPSICDIGDDGSVDSECGPECVVIFEIDMITGTLMNDTIDWGFTECGECSGRMSALSLRYNGPGPVFIEIVEHNGATVFADVVETGDFLSFFGQDNQGTLGSRINIFIDGIPVTEIHTSCSEDLFIGRLFDDFEIIAGTSRNAGALCAPGEFP